MRGVTCQLLVELLSQVYAFGFKDLSRLLPINAMLYRGKLLSLYLFETIAGQAKSRVQRGHLLVGLFPIASLPLFNPSPFPTSLYHLLFLLKRKILHFTFTMLLSSFPAIQKVRLPTFHLLPRYLLSVTYFTSQNAFSGLLHNFGRPQPRLHPLPRSPPLLKPRRRPQKLI